MALPLRKEGAPPRPDGDAFRTVVQYRGANDNARGQNVVDINDGTRRRGGIQRTQVLENPYPSTDQIFSAEYSKKGLQPQGLGATASQPEASGDAMRTNIQYQRVEESYDEYRQRGAQGARTSLQQDLITSGKGLIIKETDKARALFIYGFLWWIHGVGYLCVQLPLALLGLVFLALGAMAAAVSSTWVGYLTAPLVNAINGVLRAVGINLAVFDPMNLFMVFHIVVLGLGVIGLLFTTLIYATNLFKPLSGQKATLKMVSFLGCIIGYSMPFLNLIPFIYIYLRVMKKYPS